MQAVKSDPPFDYVLHTASPFHFNVQDPVKDFLDPAIKGTTGILSSIKKYAPSVKRVVVTSSFAAIINKNKHKEVYDETVWNPVTWEEALDHTQVYRASKVRDLSFSPAPMRFGPHLKLTTPRWQTFAEKAAWEFVEKEKPNFDLATINPPLVFGPVAHYLDSLEALNTSNQRIRDLIQGKFKDGLPPTGTFLWVDVRDVALAHVRAIEVPQAGGNRFFVTAGSFANKDLAEAVRETHPELESKLPPKDTPSDLPADVYKYNNKKSIEVLGLKYHPLKETVDDTVKTLQAVGVGK